jgi:hypothetical protein
LARHPHTKSLRYLFSGWDGCRYFNRAAHVLIINHDATESALVIESAHGDSLYPGFLVPCRKIEATLTETALSTHPKSLKAK